jgi:hypothetical protein
MSFSCHGGSTYETWIWNQRASQETRREAFGKQTVQSGPHVRPLSGDRTGDAGRLVACSAAVAVPDARTNLEHPGKGVKRVPMGSGATAVIHMSPPLHGAATELEEAKSPLAEPRNGVVLRP